MQHNAPVHTEEVIGHAVLPCSTMWYYSLL